MPSVEIAKLYRVSWADPAGGGSSAPTGISRAAILTIGLDHYLERIFILEAWIERVATSVLEQRILYTQNKWKPIKFGIDATATQVLFFDTMKRKAREEGVVIHWHPESLHGDKQFSIETAIQPIAAQGRIFRPEEKYCRQLKEEWMRHPNKHMNDGMDALANAIRLLPTTMPEHMKAMDEAQLRRYLGRTGMSQDKIAATMAQHKAIGEHGNSN